MKFWFPFPANKQQRSLFCPPNHGFQWNRKEDTCPIFHGGSVKINTDNFVLISNPHSVLYLFIYFSFSLKKFFLFQWNLLFVFFCSFTSYLSPLSQCAQQTWTKLSEAESSLMERKGETEETHLLICFLSHKIFIFQTIITLHCLTLLIWYLPLVLTY